MSLHGKIDVEPLSEGRMAKIKKSVFERLDDEDRSESMATPVGRSRSARRLAYVAAALAVAACLVLGLGFAWRALRPQHTAFADSPTRIVTGASDSHLSLGESSLDVSRGSVLLVNGDDDRGILLVLERGTVACDVAPRGRRPPFVVQAGAVRVRVVGTHFTVTRLDDSARVDVAHGTVEIKEGGRTTMVKGGETWGPTPVAQAAPPAVPTAAPEPARAPAADDLRPPRRGPAPRVPATSPAVPSRPATESFETTPPLPAAAAAPSATGESLMEATSSPATATAGPSAEATPAASAPTHDAIVRPDGGDQQLFEQATKVERQDPLRALVIYGRLAAGSGPWAANALFAQGRLESDRHHLSEGRRLLGAYLARYPRGPNAADAKLLLDRLK